jgi:hypothetical protein
MRWYIAAAFSRRDEMREVRERLLSVGEEVQATWIVQHTDMTKHPNDEMRGEDAITDLTDITKSDALLFFTDPEKSKIKVTGGRHTELGIALALNKRVCLVGKPENVFHYLPSIEIYSDFDAFLEEGLT